MVPSVARITSLLWFASLDRAACAKATADMEVFRETAAEIIRASAADDAPAALRSSYVAQLAHKEKLAPEDCIQESVSLLIAGHETSSNTACWILHLLATNPEQQAKCRAEADASPATPSYQDFLAMTTLVGAVYETLRLYTIIVGPAKKMTRDDQIPGVPKHTYVLPNKTVMGRCPMQFPSPDKFDCARYDRGEHGKMGEPHCPFGAGPRICVGYALAQLELGGVDSWSITLLTAIFTGMVVAEASSTFTNAATRQPLRLNRFQNRLQASKAQNSTMIVPKYAAYDFIGMPQNDVGEIKKTNRCTSAPVHRTTPCTSAPVHRTTPCTSAPPLRAPVHRTTPCTRVLTPCAPVYVCCRDPVHPCTVPPLHHFYFPKFQTFVTI